MLEFYRDENRKWRWRVRSSNGRILADSGQGYTRKIDAESGAWKTGAAIQRFIEGEYEKEENWENFPYEPKQFTVTVE